MITMLKNWQGPVEINDKQHESIDSVLKANFKENTQIHIKLYPQSKKAVNEPDNAEKSQVMEKQEYRIKVKKYMTEKSTPEFMFMANVNNDNPMPLRIMTGTVEKETRGMVYMKLHGDMYATKMLTCMKCGRKLTNKVSQYFGIGPECGGHAYVHPFDTEEELDKAVASYRKQLQAVTWEGWIIRSAIIEEEEL